LQLSPWSLLRPHRTCPDRIAPPRIEPPRITVATKSAATATKSAEGDVGARRGVAGPHGEVAASDSSWRAAEGRQDLPCYPTRRGGDVARTGHGGAREVPEASRPGPSRVAPTDSLEAERQDKLYHKVMFLYYQLASPEEQIRMAEPIGWRPELPMNISLQEQLRILQARLDAKHPPAPPSAPVDP
jgi:hypothetical protein